MATVVGGWIGRGSRGGGSGAGWVDRQGKIPRGIWKAAAGDGTHLLDFRVRLEFDLYIAKRLSLGALGPFDLNRTDEKNRLGSPKRKTETFYRRLGMIRTQR